ncbi:hypothetical protein [Luteolibacter sp. LG18]|uniref:hypothetical protein n=1 Tax=Luteolibacter sp. LG18 TaxID=2819286 RepID=UPI002B310E6C|nr:hypothetical protein llg_20950 [Luteolibacter sp. LG18]
MRRGRYSLPDERPDTQSSFGQLLQRHWPWLVALELPPVAAFLWRGLSSHEWGVAAPAWLGAGAGFGFWHVWLRRTIDTNHGTYTRHATPLRYWFNMSHFALFYLFTITMALFGGHQ